MNSFNFIYTIQSFLHLLPNIHFILKKYSIFSFMLIQRDGVVLFKKHFDAGAFLLVDVSTKK